MCFSPEVDVAVGLVISAVAVEALRNVRSKKILPLALLPLLFATHSFASALTWCGFDGSVSAEIAEGAKWYFMVVAFVVLPMFVPLAVAAVETDRRRLVALGSVSVLGWIAGIDYLMGIMNGEGTATACSLYIDYNVSGVNEYSGILYLIATCGSVLLSSHRTIALWGMSNLLVVVFLGFWNRQGLPSIWCLWAAATSFVIAVFVRQYRKAHERAPIDSSLSE
jgi:hypothetical protein